MRKFTEIHRLQAMYENYIALTVSRQSARQYCKCLSIFFDHFQDRKEPQEFTRADIEDYRVVRLREGVKPSTVNYELRITGGFWRWMMDMGKVSWNPISQIRSLKEKEPSKKSLTISEQLSLQKGCFQWEDHALVALALTTGLRAASLSALTKSMVNFEESRLAIPADIMKAGRNHEVPLPAWVLDILREAPDEGTIFGKYARNAAAVSYRWNCICRRSGITIKGIRTARRSFATTLLRSGADLKLVQDLLGHRNIATTSRYLTPADSEQTRAAVEKLPRPGDSL